MILPQRLRLALARRRCRLPLQARLLRQPLPSPRTLLAELELVALHLETAGRAPGRDTVGAAGWVLVRGDHVVMASARELGVRDRATEDAGQDAVMQGDKGGDHDDVESPDALVGQLLPDLAGRAVAMHDAVAGRALLDALLRRMGGVPMPNPFVSTMALEQRLLRAECSRVEDSDLMLDASRARHGLPEHRRHSAGAEAVACAELLLAQIERLGGADQIRLRALI